MVSALGNVIGFLDRIGIYDVVLPFLLVFTIMFSIFERSKILTKDNKNLNAMSAFVIAFLVIASSKLVSYITLISSQVVVLVLVSIFFVLLVGIFHKEGNLGTEGMIEPWKTIFIWINFIGLILIFLNAIKTDQGKTWLEVLINWLNQFWTSAAVASVILIIVIIIFMRWVMKDTEAPKKDEKKEEKK